MAARTLRDIFRRRWKAIRGVEWADTPEDARKLATGEAHAAFVTLNKNQQARLLKGVLADWDITLLRAILVQGNYVSNTMPADAVRRVEQENRRIEELAIVRNAIMHHPTFAMDQEEFDRMWERLKLALTYLGVDASSVDDLKTPLST